MAIIKAKAAISEKGVLPAETKLRIIQSARALFMQDGYDKTSVNAIIESAKVAKGTFYHYFKSKEELIDSILDTLTLRIIDEMNSVVSEKTDAITKINRVLDRGRQFKIEQKDLLKMLVKAIYHPGNLILRHKLKAMNMKYSKPLFERIIGQGEKEGTFRTAGPEETALIIISITEGLSEINSEYVLKKEKTKEDSEKIARISFAFDSAICRLLGVQEGKIKCLSKEFLDAIAE